MRLLLIKGKHRCINPLKSAASDSDNQVITQVALESSELGSHRGGQGQTASYKYDLIRIK